MFDSIETRPILAQAFEPEQFDDHFSARQAQTPQMFEQVLKLRHQVYCIEKKYETSSPATALETDAYDHNAIHAALIHVQTGDMAGCFRLIRPAGPDSLAGTPLYDQYADELYPEATDAPAATTAEISRFAIAKDFRNRRIAALREARALGAMTEAEEVERRLLPHLTIGLMRSVYLLSRRSGLTHLTALIDAGLLRHMHRFGLKFDIIGPPIHHKGWRYPVVSEIAENCRRVALRRPDVWNLVTHRPAEPNRDAA
ncbi:MAG: hypothetical protein Tsb0010_05200 [Parvularculaceae bacterium]